MMINKKWLLSNRLPFSHVVFRGSIFMERGSMTHPPYSCHTRKPFVIFYKIDEAKLLFPTVISYNVAFTITILTFNVRGLGISIRKQNIN